MRWAPTIPSQLNINYVWNYNLFKKNLHILCSASWIHYWTYFDNFGLLMTVEEWSSFLPRKNWGFQNSKNAINFSQSLSLALDGYLKLIDSLAIHGETFWCPLVLMWSCLYFHMLGVVLFINIKEWTIAEQSVDITYDYLSPSKNNLGSILNQ